MVEKFLIAVELRVENAFVLKTKTSLNSKEISKLLEACKPLRAKNISLYSTPAENFKFGIGVSKKNLPRAVDRNKVRRILRMIIRSYVKSHQIETRHIFFIAKSTVLGVDFVELKNEVEQLLLKAI
ncbi:MAG: ribonuclease P protein component [Rickettsiales bacterium]